MGQPRAAKQAARLQRQWRQCRMAAAKITDMPQQPCQDLEQCRHENGVGAPGRVAMLRVENAGVLREVSRVRGHYLRAAVVFTVMSPPAGVAAGSRQPVGTAPNARASLGRR